LYIGTNLVTGFIMDKLTDQVKDIIISNMEQSNIYAE
jgi:hypothetical protein